MSGKPEIAINDPFKARASVLPRDFSADEGEITPTLKLKRRVCQEHFAAEIEALYS